jgi:hypothetical protein
MNEGIGIINSLLKWMVAKDQASIAETKNYVLSFNICISWTFILISLMFDVFEIFIKFWVVFILFKIQNVYTCVKKTKCIRDTTRSFEKWTSNEMYSLNQFHLAE